MAFEKALVQRGIFYSILFRSALSALRLRASVALGPAFVSELTKVLHTWGVSAQLLIYDYKHNAIDLSRRVNLRRFRI